MGRLDFAPFIVPKVAVKDGNLLVVPASVLGNVNLFAQMGFSSIDLQVSADKQANTEGENIQVSNL